MHRHVLYENILYQLKSKYNQNALIRVVYISQSHHLKSMSNAVHTTKADPNIQYIQNSVKHVFIFLVDSRYLNRKFNQLCIIDVEMNAYFFRNIPLWQQS